MNIDLHYFSGTGNSRRILDTCKETFIRQSCTASLSSITEPAPVNQAADLLGFCFPVYAFALPRIARKYLADLPTFKTPVKVFLLITAGDSAEAGFAVQQGTELLQAKGLEVVYSEVVQMPNNWTVAMDVPSKDEAQVIIDAGVQQAKELAQRILDNTERHHRFNYPPRYSRLGFYKDYFLFKWLGVTTMWQDFRTEASCDGCGLCEKMCPTRSVTMADGKPVWSATCEQCMRCVNFCPKKAIYQKGYGSIADRNTYHEPSFKPLGPKDRS